MDNEVNVKDGAGLVYWGTQTPIYLHTHLLKRGKKKKKAKEKGVKENRYIDKEIG